jgi:dethiobiotin synthetase
MTRAATEASNRAMRGVFVTGTDTDVGKTRVAVALLHALAGAGVRAIGVRPVAAGCAPERGVQADVGVNADVAALAAADGLDVPLRDRNPYAFEPAVAPHLAAEAAGAAIELASIGAAARRLQARADVLIVEGAGGALVPLDATHDMLDVAVHLDLPVLLVVGMRLGCLNHALAAALAIRRRGLVLCGYVVNVLPPPMALLDRNVATLSDRLGMPPVAVAGAFEWPRFDDQALTALGLVSEPC